ncbi:MAG: response regulator [Polyangiales bacterium]
MDVPAPLPRPKSLVWVVDDSPLEAELARRALAEAFEVEVVNDGSVALEQLAAGRKPELLVLDWHMPGVSGLDVCRFLRSNPVTQTLPVLMLTVQSQTHDLVEALAAGADDYVVKPFKTAELAARVSAMIRSKRLRDRVARAEATTRQLLDQHPDALITIDEGERIVFVNAEARRMLAHLGVDELLQRDIRSILPGLVLDKVPDGRDFDLFPLPDVHLADSIYSPVVRTLATDEATAVTMSFRDVTDRRRVEARKLDFYSIIAHDLRSPLTVVTLKSELILRGRRGEVSPEVLADVKVIKSRIDGVLTMVDDFLDLAKLEATGLRLDVQDVDLGALAAESIEDFHVIGATRGVKVELEPLAGDMIVVGDKRRLAQVFSNRLSNAVKFSRDGGAIRVSVRREGDSIATSVRDTGRGIAATAIPMLFQRYSRAPDPANVVAGTGLGLMIVREIIDAHGGVVSVESEPGVGSTFTFTIPASPSVARGLRPSAS